jgi:hypothetical protein
MIAELEEIDGKYKEQRIIESSVKGEQDYLRTVEPRRK